LKPIEQNYSVTEMEALAIVEAVIKLRNYLLGIKFRIITDHCGLCAVFKTDSANSKLNRWKWMQEFDFEVIHTKGAMHSDVDCLSKAPIPDELDDFLDDKLLTTYLKQFAAARNPVLVSPLAKDEWRVALANDDEAKQLETKAKHRRDGFKKVDGVLYKNYRLYVPKSERENLLQVAHKSDLAGNGDIQATLDRLDSFWWL